MTPTKDILKSPVHLLAFGFGSGLSPVAPGTMGTLVAIPIYWLLSFFPTWFYLLAVALALIAGIWICGQSAKQLGVHDHGGIVWDEIVGYLITMIAAPSGLLWIVLGFALFRLFDIWKPWPIYILDHKVSGGFGIMIDDVVAGIYALIVMQILAWVF
jgi:phosphatidylglycerophosphatase A